MSPAQSETFLLLNIGISRNIDKYTLLYTYILFNENKGKIDVVFVFKSLIQ